MIKSRGAGAGEFTWALVRTRQDARSALAGADDNEHDAPDERQAAEDWRQRHAPRLVLFDLEGPDFRQLLARGEAEPTLGRRDDTDDDQDDTDEHERFQGTSRIRAVSVGLAECP